MEINTAPLCRLHPHLINTLQKWSAKINAVSPSTLLSATASRTTFRQRGSQLKGVAEIVDELLRDEKVVGRTRVLRNNVAQLGPQEEAETPETREVFDDTDFYHQLLRDVVESKRGMNGTNYARSKACFIEDKFLRHPRSNKLKAS